MTNETETLTSGIDPASFSSVIKPTNDLFRYVNGPWIDTYRLPDDRSRYGSFDKLAEDAENQVRDILDADDCPAVKSEALYRSFLNTDAIEAAGLDPIRDELDLIDSAIDKAALTRVLGTINPAGGPDLFGLAVYGDPGDPDRNIAHLEQAGLCLPDEAYYREDHYAPVREAYVAMVATQLVNAGYAPAAESNGGDELPSNTGDDESNAPATVPSEAALGMARHFLAVETKIAANHWDNVATRDSVKTYNPTDYADLAATLKNFDLGSWIDAWQTAYDATEAAKAQPIDFKSVFARVIVHEPSFLTGLDAFWAEADLADLKLWARVHMILGFASSLSRDFDTTNFDFYGKVLSGAKKQRDRWKRAVSLVNGICGEDVGREYVRLHFPESSKRRMEELVANLIDAYRVSITNSDWLGEDTKAKALEKISKFTPKIGYTNHWRDYSALSVSADALPAENAQGREPVRDRLSAGQGRQVGRQGRMADESADGERLLRAEHERHRVPGRDSAAPVLRPEGRGCGELWRHRRSDRPRDRPWLRRSGFAVRRRRQAQQLVDRRGSQGNFEARTGASDRPVQQRSCRCSWPRSTPTSLIKAPHVNGALTIGENIGDLGGVNIALKAYAFALGEAAGKSDAKEDGSPAAIKCTADTAPTIGRIHRPAALLPELRLHLAHQEP